MTRPSNVLSSTLDLLRVIGGLILANALLSWWFTSSPTWGYDGRWVDYRYLKFRAFESPVRLTLDELSLYNGTSPELPIYVAINGTVYDVTSSPRFYGPGGTYHAFSGRDSARAFVTGCYDKEDELTHDLRGLDKDEIEDQLGGWIRFFGNNRRYWVAGTVDLPEPTGEIPSPCEHQRYPGHA
ncbi:hypothetical protein FT663_01836 [Candidozyma haemuli var. vulneris]|uniref:Cytochrome b5 heme-binding domain-containing protein n=1 Tax=Candidozyma haemuli TaxID=45357 RepID=A0A2V1AMC0_9ASCO|nr:hypothetical protein CXQ85_003283 [[Candida] haemuloni]KAF3993501.1 hypothetical protein FT663_01836 [[Candida] haemuloni var. vulneris]KAF3993865.1 hypothetical protein FT662_00313 [[Candida] haemuloni var. vulneris]PVH19437.1 hypothetical protein CXQ85_003283 [[Candida] haemuloni]